MYDSNVRYPDGCSGSECEFEALWAVDSEAGEVHMKLRASSAEWVAVGFGDKAAMVCIHSQSSAGPR